MRSGLLFVALSLLEIVCAQNTTVKIQAPAGANQLCVDAVNSISPCATDCIRAASLAACNDADDFACQCKISTSQQLLTQASCINQACSGSGALVSSARDSACTICQAAAPVVAAADPSSSSVDPALSVSVSLPGGGVSVSIGVGAANSTTSTTPTTTPPTSTSTSSTPTTTSPTTSSTTSPTTSSTSSTTSPTTSSPTSSTTTTSSSSSSSSSSGSSSGSQTSPASTSSGGGTTSSTGTTSTSASPSSTPSGGPSQTTSQGQSSTSAGTGTSPTVSSPPDCLAGPAQCSPLANAIPVCASSCLASIGSAVGCGSDDYACSCSNQIKISLLATTCLVAPCTNAPNILDVLASASAVCTCVSSVNSICATPRTTPTGSGTGIGTITPNPTSICGVGTCSTAAAQIPQCAQSCYSAANGAAGCDPNDYGCQCAQQTAVQQSALACVVSACGGAEQALTASSSVDNVCACVTSSSTPCPTSTPAPSGGFAESSTTGTATGPVVTPIDECPCNTIAAQIPKCAGDCVQSAIKEIGCSKTDYSCICQQQNLFSLDSNQCIMLNCGLNAELATQNVTSDLCSCVAGNPTLCNGAINVTLTGSFSTATVTATAIGFPGSGASRFSVPFPHGGLIGTLLGLGVFVVMLI